MLSSEIAGTHHEKPHLLSLWDHLIRLTETISVHFFRVSEIGKENGPSTNTDKSKFQMVTKRTNKALLEVIPPRICITFRRTCLWSRPKGSEIEFWEDRAENTINTCSESYGNFSGKVNKHEKLSVLDAYLTLRAGNQGI